MSKPLTCGIIGCGVISRTHVRALQAAGDIDVRWACDLDVAKAKSLSCEFAVAKTTANYREVLADADVDFVCICTDHAAHVAVAVDAINAGKDVLCEKALAADSRGVRDMIGAHEAYPERVFGVVFQHRLDPVNRLVKELIQSGALGQILTGNIQLRCQRTDEYYLGDDWRGTWEHEGGAVLINQAIHFIDLLVWFMGPADSLCGTYANLTHEDSMETEDTAAALLRFPSRSIGSIEATCSSHLKWEGTVAIHGTEGSLEIRNDRPIKIEFRDAELAESVRERFATCHAESADAALGKTYYGTGHAALIAEFADAVRERRKPFVTVRSAAHTMDVVLGIYRSHKQDGWIRLQEGT
ncbi:MAG: Gfo/Idh/MocA family protein [Verrucomicrobiota bacterium]